MFKKSTIFLFLIFSFNFAYASKSKVALIVMLDLSGSMDKHREKMAALAPLVAEAMQNSRCEYKVAVTNVLYDDAENNSLLPLGSPAFVDPKTSYGSELITQRILQPERSNLPLATARGDQELTYSSIAHIVAANAAELARHDVVGTLLLTDAAPAYETMPPQQALDKVYGSLGSARYVPGVITTDLEEDMLVFNPGHTCNPDFPNVSYKGGPDPDLRINPQEWKSKDILALENFVKRGQGWRWSVCRNDYEESLREFLQMIMDVAGCQLLV